MGEIKDFSFSLLPATLGICLLTINQYVDFYGMPRFLRLALMFATTSGLVDLRDMTWHQTNQPSMDWTFFRSLFPFAIHELVVALMVNRLLILWNALPGLVILGCCMTLTDAPMDFVLHVMLIVVLSTLTLPLFYSVMLCTSNLRTSLRSWMVGMAPAMLAAVLYPLVLMLGVAGGIAVMRVDYAYFGLAGSAVFLSLVLLYVKFVLDRGWLDEALTPISLPGIRLPSN